jgi:hypothetical protein
MTNKHAQRAGNRAGPHHQQREDQQQMTNATRTRETVADRQEDEIILDRLDSLTKTLNEAIERIASLEDAVEGQIAAESLARSVALYKIE